MVRVNEALQCYSPSRRPYGYWRVPCRTGKNVHWLWMGERSLKSVPVGDTQSGGMVNRVVNPGAVISMLCCVSGGRAGSRGSTGARTWSGAAGGNSSAGNSEHCVNPGGVAARSAAKRAEAGAGRVTPPAPTSVTSYYRLQALVIVMWLVMWLRDHSAKRAINSNILRHVIRIMINTTTTVTMATSVIITMDTTATMATSTVITMDTNTDIITTGTTDIMVIITMATSDIMLPTVRKETHDRKWTRKRHVMRLLTTPTGKR